ncbi:MAG: hypothetical protein M3009_03280 [Bombella apis]|uniref:hypothetical protein n=1 Tax=Bombella apis TaxID=1785988 RepID=UPI0023F1F199|nr:hypothetical protein [Bombella apis]MCT6819481.1 hypothetical protein [Bombella apis]
MSAYANHSHDIKAGFFHDAMPGDLDGFILGFACIKDNLLEEPEQDIRSPLRLSGLGDRGAGSLWMKV